MQFDILQMIINYLSHQQLISFFISQKILRTTKFKFNMYYAFKDSTALINFSNIMIQGINGSHHDHIFAQSIQNIKYLLFCHSSYTEILDIKLLLNLPNLEYLRLDRTKIINGKSLHEIKKLRYLEISSYYNDFSTSHLFSRLVITTKFVKFEQQQKLSPCIAMSPATLYDYLSCVHLKSTFIHISDVNLTPIILSTLPNIQTIKIKNCICSSYLTITYSHLKSLTIIDQPQLQTLDLTQCSKLRKIKIINCNTKILYPLHLLKYQSLNPITLLKITKY